MYKPTKKATAVLLGAVLVLASVGAAVAYWTGVGSGNGTVGTGTSAAITVNQTSTLTALKPGLAAQTLSGDFTNATTGNVYVTTVTASIASVVKDAAAVAGTCDATDYTLTGAAMTVGANEPIGSNVGSWTGATLAFNDKVTNQDQCKLATVTLAYSVT